MRLLICTQAVDRDDPVLGFMHRWVEGLAKRYERIVVVCLRSGDHAFPPHVEVIPLGESRRFLRALEVCSVAFARRKEYDHVFVHMNQEYVLAAGWLWKALGKRIYLWRNHYAGNMLTDIAAAFCSKVFCTSRFSYTAKYKKTVLMPVGVDTERFAPVSGVARVPKSILFLARIAPSKGVHLLIDALVKLRASGASFTASICGSPAKGDEPYASALEKKAASAGLSQAIRFMPGIPNDKAPALYSAHEIFVNLSASGMYDKTIFEAAACGCFVLASSRDFAEHVPQALTFAEGDADDITAKLKALLSASEEEKRGFKHSLETLAQRNTLRVLVDGLVREMSK